MDRRTLPDRSRRGGRACAPADGRGAARAVREAGAGRHLPEPERGRDVHEPDVQAHPRADLAADVRLRDEVLPGGRERRHRTDLRIPAVELDQSLAGGVARADPVPDFRVSEQSVRLKPDATTIPPSGSRPASTATRRNARTSRLA